MRKIAERTLELVARVILDENPKLNTTDIVLATIAIGGFVVAVGYFPALLAAVYALRSDKKFSKKHISSAYHSLIRHGIVDFSNGKPHLTEKGNKRMSELEIDTIKIKKSLKWDGRWRLVFFDLPVRYKKVRDAFRFKLKKLGFKQMQKSVWILPYKCNEEITFVSEYFQVYKYVNYVECSFITDERHWKREFKI